jgi:hypothetical protein
MGGFALRAFRLRRALEALGLPISFTAGTGPKGRLLEDQESNCYHSRTAGSWPRV